MSSIKRVIRVLSTFAVASALVLPAVGFAQGASSTKAKQGAAGNASTLDADALLYRQKIMRAMNEQSAILGQIVSGAVPNDNVALHLESMALLASTGLKAYERQALGGEAKPDIWKNWPDFSKRMRQFSDDTNAAAKLVKTAGPDAALTNMMDAMSCRACHRAYRDDKK